MRRHAGAGTNREPTRELTFSLGRMVNGVGGSVIHYGGWLRRFPAHNFRLRSHALERWGRAAIPEGSTVVDWPITYDELRPYFAEVERIVGIGGDEDNVFLPHDQPYPLPRDAAVSDGRDVQWRRRGAWDCIRTLHRLG